MVLGTINTPANDIARNINDKILELDPSTCTEKCIKNNSNHLVLSEKFKQLVFEIIDVLNIDFEQNDFVKNLNKVFESLSIPHSSHHGIYTFIRVIIKCHLGNAKPLPFRMIEDDLIIDFN